MKENMTIQNNVPHMTTTLFRSRPAITLSNGIIEITVLLGGGHIAALRHVEEGTNVLWEPSWPSLEPSLRNVIPKEIYGTENIGKLLASICGHNLCVDVFGAHSEGEINAGMSFHGEAGMVTWVAENFTVKDGVATLSLYADLPLSMMHIHRDIIITHDSCEIKIVEKMKNNAGFERVIGRAQHVTMGRAFLENGVNWTCNADHGITSDNKEEFSYPYMTNTHGGTDDWRIFPRKEGTGGVVSLRINPKDDEGFFTATSKSLGLELSYRWEREAFPWITTWEEHYNSKQKPWCGKELARGVEFSSYMLPTSRRSNVEQSTLFETPCFEWLDAFEEKTTSYKISLHHF